MLNRMNEAMDNILRQEQTGFRKGRSCCEQIFTLCQIIEKVQARDRSLYISFVDFQKAFDNVHKSVTVGNPEVLWHTRKIKQHHTEFL